MDGNRSGCKKNIQICTEYCIPFQFMWSLELIPHPALLPPLDRCFPVVQNLFLKSIFSFFFLREKKYKLSSSFTILAFQRNLMSMNAKCAIKTAPSVNKSDF